MGKAGALVARDVDAKAGGGARSSWYSGCLPSPGSASRRSDVRVDQHAALRLHSAARKVAGAVDAGGLPPGAHGVLESGKIPEAHYAEGNRLGESKPSLVGDLAEPMDAPQRVARQEEWGGEFFACFGGDET